MRLPTIFHRLLTLVLLFSMSTESWAAKLSLVPVRSSAPYTRIGLNGIVLYPGAQQLFLEFYVYDWNTDHDGTPVLTGAGARVGPAGFSNPVCPSSLRLAEQPCTTDDDCSLLFQTSPATSLCRTQAQLPAVCVSGGNCCSPLYVDTGHGNTITDDFDNSVILDELFVECVARNDSLNDIHIWKYFGTLVLDIPADAFGEFIIPLRPFAGLSGGTSSFYRFKTDPLQSVDELGYVSGQDLYPARVYIGVQPKQVFSSKNRYLSFIPGEIEKPSAYAVELVSLHHPARPAPSPFASVDFTPFEGQLRWIGPPALYPMAAAQPQHVFHAARLQCTPHVSDWSTFTVIEVYGPEVIPDSFYRIRRYDASCTDPDNPLCVFDDVGEMRTGRWGDIVSPFENDVHNTSGAQPNFSDVAGLIDQLKDLPGAPSKAQCQLRDNLVDPARLIDAIDNSYVVSAFKGLAYPFAGPSQRP